MAVHRHPRTKGKNRKKRKENHPRKRKNILVLPCSTLEQARHGFHPSFTSLSPAPSHSHPLLETVRKEKGKSTKDKEKSPIKRNNVSVLPSSALEQALQGLCPSFALPPPLSPPPPTPILPLPLCWKQLGKGEGKIAPSTKEGRPRKRKNILVLRCSTLEQARHGFRPSFAPPYTPTKCVEEWGCFFLKRREREKLNLPQCIITQFTEKALSFCPEKLHAHVSSCQGCKDCKLLRNRVNLLAVTMA